MLLLRSLVFNILCFGLMLVMGILMAPLAIWSVNGAYFAIQTYARLILWLLDKICGLKTEIRGEIPTGEVIVCSKHQSFYDIIILAGRLPRAKFIMKKELRWAPILGLYALRIGSTPVHRGKKSKAMREMVDHAGKESDPGQLVIYPQGTRVAPDVRMPYKVGAGVLYDRLGRPCVPAATNVGLFWGRHTVYRRPGIGVIEFLEPIPAGLPVSEFMVQIENTVEDRSDALMREAGFDPGPREPRTS